MSRPIPIYKDDGETFQADTCLPLIEAVGRNEVQLDALVHGHYPGRKLAPGTLPGIKTVGFWDACHDQAWGLPWHRNEGLELTFLESGAIPFAVDSRQHQLHPDDLTVTRPWQRHRVGEPNVAAGRLHWLILDVEVRRPNQSWKWPNWLLLSNGDLDELTNVLRHNERAVWKASGDIRHCFQAIAQAVHTDRNGSSTSRLAVRVNDLFILLLDLFRGQKVRLNESLSSSRRTVELFLADVRTHPEHLASNWTLREMANSCGLGITQFVHHVKLLTNMTPIQYCNQCRLELAARLLRENIGTSVTEIALACGFSSSQYFATAFNDRFGQSPRQFRRVPES
jgi:AraC-like DNA-binding protein